MQPAGVVLLDDEAVVRARAAGSSCGTGSGVRRASRLRRYSSSGTASRLGRASADVPPQPALDLDIVTVAAFALRVPGIEDTFES